MTVTTTQALFAAVDYLRKIDAESADTWHGAWSRRDARDVVVMAACALVDDARGTREQLGKQCIDGGKCHHACTERCYRRECCGPLTGYVGPWSY